MHHYEQPTGNAPNGKQVKFYFIIKIYNFVFYLGNNKQSKTRYYSIRYTYTQIMQLQLLLKLH